MAMARKEQVQVDEAMMRGIMMKEVPVYDNGDVTVKEDTPVPAPATVPDPDKPEGSQEIPLRPEGRGPSAKRKKRESEPEEGYAERFLVNDRSRNRVSANISRELFNRIRKYLPVVAPDVTLTSYLNNIISEHIENHRDEIDKLYKREIEKPLE
jgi:hypothetical protein